MSKAGHEITPPVLGHLLKCIEKKDRKDISQHAHMGCPFMVGLQKMLIFF